MTARRAAITAVLLAGLITAAVFVLLTLYGCSEIPTTPKPTVTPQVTATQTPTRMPSPTFTPGPSCTPTPPVTPQWLIFTATPTPVPVWDVYIVRIDR
jgi:hypothetical protein